MELLSPRWKKSVKNLSRKSFLYSRKWNFLAQRLKNFLFSMFLEIELSSLILSYISGKNSPSSEKSSYSFSKKTFLILRETELPYIF